MRAMLRCPRLRKSYCRTVHARRKAAESCGLEVMKHVDTIHRTEAWLFDLDNTLYPASCGLMAAVSRRMTRFVAEILGVDHGTALIEQKRLFREHGTTLRGLMDRFSVDPVVFMDYVHAVEIGRAHVCTPVTNAHLVCLLLL